MTEIQARVERELTYVIGRYARTWAVLEHYLSRLMAAALRIDARASDVIYHALRNDRARRDVIEAAATLLKEDEDRKSVARLLRRAGNLARDRAIFLHNLTEVEPDGTVLIVAAQFSYKGAARSTARPIRSPLGTSWVASFSFKN